jgi:HEPN domain-containing protein
MNEDRLARTYFRKSAARRKALEVLFTEQSYGDVVREAQEICELVLKAVLRLIGIDPPKFHDVGKIVKENRGLLPQEMHDKVDPIARYSFELRRDRELAFVGAVDVDPWDDYTEEDARQAIGRIEEILAWVRPLSDGA